MIDALPPSWCDLVGADVTASVVEVLARVEQERQRSTVYPPRGEVFAAFSLCPASLARVVVIGQDPYHGPGQAHGLAFSVLAGTPLPPSLRNIFKELQRSGATPLPPLLGDLSAWARQGVLLLNTSLTVRDGEPGSHAQIGWFEATQAVVAALDRGPRPLAFVLWGSHAQRVGANVDRRRHLVLEAPHPSPLSAHRGFFGCNHFVAINEWLVARGERPIDWAT